MQLGLTEKLELTKTNPCDSKTVTQNTLGLRTLEFNLLLQAGAEKFFQESATKSFKHGCTIYMHKKFQNSES